MGGGSGPHPCEWSQEWRIMMPIGTVISGRSHAAETIVGDWDERTRVEESKMTVPKPW